MNAIEINREKRLQKLLSESEEIVSKHISNLTKTERDMVRRISLLMNIKKEYIFLPVRYTEIVDSRSFMCKWFKRNTKLSLPQIGRKISITHHNHATVIHSLDEISHMIENNDRYRMIWESIKYKNGSVDLQIYEVAKIIVSQYEEKHKINSVEID